MTRSGGYPQSQSRFDLYTGDVCLNAYFTLALARSPSLFFNFHCVSSRGTAQLTLEFIVVVKLLYLELLTFCNLFAKVSPNSI